MRQRHSSLRPGGLVITAPLEGIRVVEMTLVVMGPYACQMLGDLGADIVKIEPLAGDTNRDLGPHANDLKMSALVLTCNRNKRSVALDLKSAAGREAALKLIETADVMVHNFRPQAMERLGLNYQQVKAVNPSVVYCATYGDSKKKAPIVTRTHWMIPFRRPAASTYCRVWSRASCAICPPLLPTRRPG